MAIARVGSSVRLSEQGLRLVFAKAGLYLCAPHHATHHRGTHCGHGPSRPEVVAIRFTGSRGGVDGEGLFSSRRSPRPTDGAIRWVLLDDTNLEGPRSPWDITHFGTYGGVGWRGSHSLDMEGLGLGGGESLAGVGRSDIAPQKNEWALGSTPSCHPSPA